MSGNGDKNLILGRQDGNVEIYYVNVHDEMDATHLIFREVIQISILIFETAVLNKLVLLQLYESRRMSS